MKANFAAYVMAAASLLASPLYAQDKPCKASVETSTVAPWYNVNGPRVSIGCDNGKNDVSIVYLPVGEDGSASNDVQVKLNSKLSESTIIGGQFERLDNAGIGGGGTFQKFFDKDTSFLVRGIALSSGPKYADVKLLSKHLDLVAGARNFDGTTKGYGYATANFGKWDDTFTFGVDANKMLWQNFTFERERYGAMEITYYRPSSGNWGMDVYSGLDDVARPWFSREIDRLIANNDILPKPRTEILAFPSYLAFGKNAAEVRAESIGGKTFVNVNAGRNFGVKNLKLGLGSGIEYTRDHGENVWNPTGEVLVRVPFLGNDIMAQYRFRKNERGFYASVSRPLGKAP